MCRWFVCGIPKRSTISNCLKKQFVTIKQYFVFVTLIKIRSFSLKDFCGCFWKRLNTKSAWVWWALARRKSSSWNSDRSTMYSWGNRSPNYSTGWGQREQADMKRQLRSQEESYRATFGPRQSECQAVRAAAGPPRDANPLKKASSRQGSYSYLSKFLPKNSHNHNIKSNREPYLPSPCKHSACTLYPATWETWPTDTDAIAIVTELGRRTPIFQIVTLLRSVPDNFQLCLQGGQGSTRRNENEIFEFWDPHNGWMMKSSMAIFWEYFSKSESATYFFNSFFMSTLLETGAY